MRSLRRKFWQYYKRVKDRSFWGRLNYSISKSRGGSVRSVKIEQDRGSIQEATTQQTVHKAIWDEIHQKRFYLAEQSHICQGILRSDFGYIACSPTAKKVLEGRCEYPEEFDLATRELLEECLGIRQTVPKQSVSTNI